MNIFIYQVMTQQQYVDANELLKTIRNYAPFYGLRDVHFIALVMGSALEDNQHG